MNIKEENTKALMVASAILNELARGTKHYDVNTGELIVDPIEICNAMRDDRLIIEYPEVNYIR